MASLKPCIASALVGIFQCAPVSAQVTQRVSLSSVGAQAHAASFLPSISSDGRYVAFVSFASSLVPGDTNGTYDVFVRDRRTGTTERVSVSSNGDQAYDHSDDPAMSADGRYVAFWSPASNLVPADTNGDADVFVHDLQTDTTERVSVSTNGTQGNQHSLYPSISADGRFVMFVSWATNLVPGDTNGIEDVFVRDRQNQTTECVSVASGPLQWDTFWNAYGTISADGRYVAFQTFADNIVPGLQDQRMNVFVRDRQTGIVELVNVDSAGVHGMGGSYDPSISADGRFVAFASYATSLVPGDTNGAVDVFLRDRINGTTERVSIDSNAVQANGDSLVASISADGRYVGFVTGLSRVFIPSRLRT